MATKQKSLKLVDKLNRARRIRDKAESHLYCWRMEEIGTEYSEEERKKMNEAAALSHSAEKIVREVYSAKIGKLIVEEIFAGDWN